MAFGTTPWFSGLLAFQRVTKDGVNALCDCRWYLDRRARRRSDPFGCCRHRGRENNCGGFREERSNSFQGTSDRRPAVARSCRDLSIATSTAPIAPRHAAAFVECADLQCASLDRYFRETLACGITTARDMGGADAGFRAAIEEGLIDGPRLLISLGMISQTGGHGDYWVPGRYAHSKARLVAQHRG